MRAAQKRRYYRQFQLTGLHKRKLWTPAEDAQITAKNSPTDRRLSKALSRSVQAIQQRRVRLSGAIVIELAGHNTVCGCPL